MSIQSNLEHIKSTLSPQVTLVAVSKTKPVSDLMEAYEAGQRIFGENKIQEMTEKWEQMPKNIEWHMIGHVQTNKVKLMAEYVSLIHGLLQIYIAEEESKFGLDEKELNELLHSEEFQSLENIKIVGLMGMATFTENQNQIKKEFTYLKSIFDKIKIQPLVNCQLSTLSMGMSGDYQLAIECGSTMIRIGSSIFGGRS
jgi:uncharacterized pyridoxal phosphate-containing UPF0001 family protein